MVPTAASIPRWRWLEVVKLTLDPTTGKFTLIRFSCDESERRQRQGSFEPPSRGRSTTQRQYADILE